MKRTLNATKRIPTDTSMLPLFTAVSDFHASGYFYLTNHVLPSKVFFENIDRKSLYEYMNSSGKIDRRKCIHSRSLKENFTINECYAPLNKHAALVFNNHNVALYYDPAKISDDFIEELGKEICKYVKGPEENHISLVTTEFGELTVQQFLIKATNIDLANHYNDDFIYFDSAIKKNLKRNKEKGLILLHGSPGTGKTSYIRHLISNVDRRFIYLPPNMAGNLSQPGFINFLTSYPNSVLVIEDAEEILSSRTGANNSAISNLLNLGDGLLSDCLNIRVICTFNANLGQIDPALLRKGRIIAKYEFKPLEQAKASKLLRSLDPEKDTGHAMSLAEIFHHNDVAYSPNVRDGIGFLQAV